MPLSSDRKGRKIAQERRAKRALLSRDLLLTRGELQKIAHSAARGSVCRRSHTCHSPFSGRTTGGAYHCSRPGLTCSYIYSLFSHSTFAERPAVRSFPQTALFSHSTFAERTATAKKSLFVFSGGGPGGPLFSQKRGPPGSYNIIHINPPEPSLIMRARVSPNFSRASSGICSSLAWSPSLTSS